MRAMIAAVVCGSVLGLAGRASAQPDPKDREIQLLKKENELLQREADLLRKEVEQLKAQLAAKGGPAGGGAAAAGKDEPAKATLDDVVYEFVSIKTDGNVAHLKLAITSKKAGRVLDTQGIRLTTADGTEHRAPHAGVQKSAPGSAALAVNVRTVVDLNIGEVPGDVKEFATIQLPGVFNGSMLTAQRMKNPVILRGKFPVER